MCVCVCTNRQASLRGRVCVVEVQKSKLQQARAGGD